MAKNPSARLKIFQAQIGFFDTVVAVPSQAAALRAWGIHQNLFATGDAKVTSDAAAAHEALKHPGAPLRRAIGSNDPYQLEPAALPNVPDRPKRSTAKSKPQTKIVQATPPPANRAALDAAEAALRTLDENRRCEEDDFQRREDQLNAEKAQARSAFVAHRKTASAALTRARQAYRDAGGTD